MTQRVYVVQEGRNDYAPAENFGEVEFITTGDLRTMEGEQNSEVYADIRRFKSEYITGHDFIVPAGNPAVVALVMMALPAGDHRLLKWDGRRATYVQYTINPAKVK